MVRGVLLDEDADGNVDERQLARFYEKIVRFRDVHEELPKGSPDRNIADYCKRNKISLLTGNTDAYTAFFDVGSKTVKITELTRQLQAKKRLYLIKIEDDQSQ